MRRLEGRIAIVNGIDALGAGIALRFAREGAALGLIGTDAAAGQALCTRVRDTGARADFVAIATPSTDAVRAAVGALADRLGGLHVLVNDPLPLPDCAPLEAQTEAMFARAFAAVQHAAAAMQAAFPRLSAQRWGRIVNIGHRYGEGVGERIAAWNSAAWALVGLTRSAAVDWGQYQIACNLLLPLADTPEYRACHDQRPALLDRLVAQTPLGRMGDPERDIGAAAAFLACDEANFVNGEVLHADGGQHVAGPVLNPARFAAR